VTIEAAACGVAVVASRIYGITDAVEEGETALLHPAGDVDALAGALRRIATDSGLRRALGAAGRERAVRVFHVDTLTSAQLALYASLLGDGEAASTTPPCSSEEVRTGWYAQFGKRLLDVAIAGSALVLLAPLMAVTAMIVRVALGGPVLFRQRRPGLHGVPFTLVKFRTMTDRYDSHGRPLPDGDRLNAFGRVLRATSLDELPELWNVLRGDMSLVGPRPLLMEYLPRYSARQARRHAVRPGITGLAQINGRNELPWAERFELDVTYTERFSLAMDLRILARTISHVAARRGITEVGHATAQEFSGVEGR
jgi:lipopolysaccharide/colanic/teichoic acid biosynthesis glycosyltransferase